METIKLFQVLNTLTKDELSSLGKFIKSPYFNESPIIVKLYEILKKHYPNYNRIEKETLFGSLYPAVKFKDKKLRDLYSSMLELTEEFLALADLKNYPLEEKKHVLNQYSIRNLDKHFEGLSRDIQSLLDKMKVKDSDYFYSSFLLKKDTRNYFEQKKSLGKRGDFYTEINTEIDSFLLFFIYKMLRYYIEQINQQKLYKHTAKLEFIEQISGYISTRDMKNEPQVNILFTCLMMLIKPGEHRHYHNLKELLAGEGKYLNKDDLKLIYIQVYNFTREKYIEGKEEYLKELFSIIKQMIEQDIYPREHGYMTAQTYINFVQTGLQEKEDKWTEQFMEDYKHKISPAGAENAHKYCKALLSYRRGDFNNALENLAEVKIEDFYYYLRVKNQTSRIYFELGEYESLLSLIDTFKHYLSSTTEIPDFIRSRFSDYVNYLSKAVHAKLAEDDLQLKMIRDEIEAAPVFENKVWLIEKMA